MRQHWEKSALLCFFFLLLLLGFFVLFFFFSEGAWERKRLFGADLDGSRPLVGEITRRSPSAAASPSPAPVGNVPLQLGSCGGGRGSALRPTTPPPPETVQLGEEGSEGRGVPRRCHPMAAALGPVPTSAVSAWGCFGGKQELGSFSSFLMLLPKILAKHI